MSDGDGSGTMAHDPACLLKDENHEGPHHVPADHPAIKGKRNVFHCRVCGYAMYDANSDDINDHYAEHVRQ